jgi:hypothetical protein
MGRLQKLRVLEARIELRHSTIVHGLQLVNKQVDIPCDGILGRDFLQHARAKICYESRTVTFTGKVCKKVSRVIQLATREPNARKMGHIKLPPRAETLVK